MMIRVAVLAWEKPSKDRPLTGVGVYLGYLAELGNFSRRKGHKLELTFIVPWERDSFLREERCDVLFLKTRGFSRKRPYDERVLYPSSRSFADRLLKNESPIDLEQFDLVFANSFAFGEFISRAQHLDNIMYVSHRPEFLRRSIAEEIGMPQKCVDRLRRDSELEAQAVRGSWRIVPVGNSCKRELVRHYKRARDDVNVIYNGVDTSFFKWVDGSQRDKTIFLYVGRNDPEKGIFLLLEAVRNLKDRFRIKNLELQLVTDNIPSLRRVIRKLGLSRCVKPIGWKNYRELPQYYSRATFTVIPSYWESFSFVVAESLSCETPVITSTAGELSNIVDSSIGLSFRTGDEEDLTKKLVRMCSITRERAREMGRHGREKVVNLFSKKTFLENYLRFVEESVKGASS